MARQRRKPAGSGKSNQQPARVERDSKPKQVNQIDKTGQSARVEPPIRVQTEAIKVPETKKEVSYWKMLGYFGGWLIIPGVIFWLIEKIWK